MPTDVCTEEYTFPVIQIGEIAINSSITVYSIQNRFQYTMILFLESWQIYFYALNAVFQEPKVLTLGLT